MPRTNTNVARHKRKKKIRKLTKGYSWARRHLLKEAKIAIRRSGQFAARDRRVRARQFRRLWISRLSGEVASRGLRYSKFIQGLKLAGITINRKMLTEIAVSDAAGFSVIFEAAKAAVAKADSQHVAKAKSA